LVRKDHKEIYNSVRDLSSNDNLGILRVTIPANFSFQKNDIEQFFEQFGRIENIIIKEPKTLDNENKKEAEGSNIAYVIFSQYFSAVVALKVLQSVSDKEKIVDAKICVA
jgi:flagellin-specific chaperone FliS